MTWEIRRGNGIALPQIGWSLDAQKSVPRAYASHAHFDHLGPHPKILCTARTAALAQARLSGQREYLTHDFGKPFELDNATTATLYPAGHIVGSSQLHLERQGESLLYTGDFKLAPSLSAEKCAAPQADILIMETTYGQPRYVFPPTSEIAADIAQFCADCLASGHTPILFAYSLGKSQEVHQLLAEAALPIMLHPEPAKLTAICESLGIDFPPYKPFDLETLPGHVVIAPPLKGDSPFLKRIQNKKTAMVTGWALDPQASYRFSCDRLFPLSDHSDYLDLIEFVSKVQPQKIYTVHGFADAFAQTLREQGYDAWPLGKSTQSTLSLATPTPLPQRIEDNPPATLDSPFAVFSQLLESLTASQTPEAKLSVLSEYLNTLDQADASIAAKLLLPADLFSPTDAKESRELLKNAFISAGLTSEAAYRERYHQTRSHPDTLSQLASQNESATLPPRALARIDSFLRAYREAASPIFRISLLGEEFKKLTPLEIKGLSHILLAKHPAPIDYSLVCSGLAARHQREASDIIDAYLKTGDISRVAEAAAQDTLSAIPLTLFHPIPLARPTPAQSPEELIAALAGESGEIWIEDLHDGFPLQIHKTQERAALYDTQLQQSAHLFPEIVDALRSIPQDFVAEGRLVAWRDERAQPSQLIQDRLSRKGEDLFLGEEIAVILWLSDLIWVNGDYVARQPLAERRRLLETFSVNAVIRIATHTNINDSLALEMAQQSALARGSLGLLAKLSQSTYRLGQTLPAWRSLQQ